MTLSGRSFKYGIETLAILIRFLGGTPESTVVYSDVSPSTIVLIFLVVEKFRSHVWMLPLISY